VLAVSTALGVLLWTDVERERYCVFHTGPDSCCGSCRYPCPLPRRYLDVVLSHYIVCPETRAILVTDFPFPFYERTCARVSVMRRWIIGQ
jgi:hypothetical protein